MCPILISPTVHTRVALNVRHVITVRDKLDGEDDRNGLIICYILRGPSVYQYHHQTSDLI